MSKCRQGRQKRAFFLGGGGDTKDLVVYSGRARKYSRSGDTADATTISSPCLSRNAFLHIPKYTETKTCTLRNADRCKDIFTAGAVQVCTTQWASARRGSSINAPGFADLLKGGCPGIDRLWHQRDLFHSISRQFTKPSGKLWRFLEATWPCILNRKLLAVPANVTLINSLSSETHRIEEEELKDY